MKCEEPYYSIEYETFFPCGKCVPCRIKRKMEWVTRLVLEKKSHEATVYLTLTYATEHLTYGGTDQPTLNPYDLTLFIKRLRRQFDYYHGLKFRYFACGEYGDEDGHRPHYHLVLFGVDESYRELYKKVWGKGYVEVLPVKKGCYEYVSGYCVKKFDKLISFYKEKKVLPEFFRSSLGLGRAIIDDVASQVVKHKMPDVPRYVIEGKKKMYLTRYWIKKIRERCFDLEYIQNLTSIYLSIGREKFMSDLAPFLPRFFHHLKDWYKKVKIELAYKECYKHIIRNNLLKYSKLLNTRGRIKCQDVVNST